MTKHKLCNVCIHARNAHCICGGDWMQITSWRPEECCEFDDFENCKTVSGWLHGLHEMSPDRFSFMLGDFINKNIGEHYEFVSNLEEAGNDDLGSQESYLPYLDKKDKTRILQAVEKTKKSLFEIIIESDNDIIVLYLLGKSEKSLLKELKSRYNSLAND